MPHEANRFRVSNCHRLGSLRCGPAHQPRGVTESVWTGIATGLFTTGLIELVLNLMRARERAEEMRRRAHLITPLDYHLEGNMLDLVLDNRSGEVAVYVVVGTHFPDDLGLMHTRAVERAFEWTSVTFDQAIQVLDSRELVGKLPWQSGRVPIVFTDIPPKLCSARPPPGDCGRGVGTSNRSGGQSSSSS